tara:strand:+ start:488 stop:766 length:279 start_codon:yes stop_codon:yes gene_type:complete
MNAKQLIWNYKDKKGKPRERDCKATSKTIKIIDKSYPNNREIPLEFIRAELETLIDPMGRSIKPMQIQLGYQSFFEHPINIKSIKRDELKLQ